MQRKEPGYSGGGTIMSIHGFGVGAGGSISLPNLRGSYRKQDIGIQSEIRPFLPTINPNFGDLALTSKPSLRSCSSPSLLKSSGFFCARRCPNPIPIPAFGAQDGFRKGSQVPNASEMILGALKAGHDHFQRGMHHSDVIQLVSSAYKLTNSSSVIRTLNTTLEKLVATGVVSKSYGVKNEDATYRLITYNPKVAATDPKLIVNGTRIKSSAANPRSRSGLCLPGSNSHLTRVARACTSDTNGIKTGNPLNRQDGKDQVMPRAYASMSDPTLSRSLADRAGSLELLKRQGFRPSSPVWSNDRDGAINERFGLKTHPINFSKEDAEYGQGDCEEELNTGSGLGHEMSKEVFQRLRGQDYGGPTTSTWTFDDVEKYESLGAIPFTRRIRKTGFSQDCEMLSGLGPCRYPC